MNELGAHRISVCMATHNGADFLEEQINSILCQLAPDDELLISDDASQDGTVTLILAQTDPRIRFLGSRYHGSPLLNFEFTLQHVSGQYIFLADQDDIWENDKVAVVLPFLQQYDLVLTDCQVVDRFNRVTASSYFDIRKSRNGFLLNLYKNGYMGCCMAFRVQLLNIALPFPAKIHMHDWWIGLLAEAVGKVYLLRQPLLRYRRHGFNASPTGESTYSRWQQVHNRFWMAVCVARRLLTAQYKLTK